MSVHYYIKMREIGEGRMCQRRVWFNKLTHLSLEQAVSDIQSATEAKIADRY